MDFEFERTLAAAEEDEVAAPASAPAPAPDQAEGPSAATADERCTCGSSEFLLEAYLQVVDGRPRSELVEVESLTCPQCGKEYEAVQMEDGRVLRGEFLGHVDLDDSED
ncbi:MAG TPA: hypothetical protein VGK67_16720 [Myxococcales bacterium]|jgi:hypothetical protein